MRAQVLVDLVNHGGAAAAFPAAGIPYRIRSPGGDVTVSGRFAHAFPHVVEPGQGAWLIDTISATFVEPQDLATLELELDAAPSADDPDGSGTNLAVDGVSWEVAASGGVRVTGTVRNVGGAPASRGIVGVVLRARDGTPLAGVYDVTAISDLRPGDAVTFATDYPTTGPVDLGAIAAADAVAIVLD